MIWTSQKIMAAIAQQQTDNGSEVLHANLVKLTGLTGKQVATACALLEKNGYLTRKRYADDSVKPGHYLLTSQGKNALADGTSLTSGPKSPHGKSRRKAGTLRERAWNLLRIKRQVSVPELIATLLDADSPVARVKSATNNLQKYFQQLKMAGYLAELRRDQPTSRTSNGAKRYLLIRNSGPLPPVTKENMRKVFDQNQQVHYDITK